MCGGVVVVVCVVVWLVVVLVTVEPVLPVVLAVPVLPVFPEAAPVFPIGPVDGVTAAGGVGDSVEVSLAELPGFAPPPLGEVKRTSVGRCWSADSAAFCAGVWPRAPAMIRPVAAAESSATTPICIRESLIVRRESITER